MRLVAISMSFAAIAILLAGCIENAASHAGMDGLRGTTMAYQCGPSARVEVIYASDGETATVMRDDEVIPMVRLPTASGLQYRASNARSPYRLERKDDQAVLYGTSNRAVLPVCHIAAYL